MLGQVVSNIPGTSSNLGKPGLWKSGGWYKPELNVLLLLWCHQVVSSDMTCSKGKMAVKKPKQIKQQQQQTPNQKTNKTKQKMMIKIDSVTRRFRVSDNILRDISDGACL